MYDSAKPDKLTTTTIRVPVLRNVNAPVFKDTSYEAAILENARVGVRILQMATVDMDNVSKHSFSSLCSCFLRFNGQLSVIRKRWILWKPNEIVNSQSFPDKNQFCLFRKYLYL